MPTPEEALSRVRAVIADHPPLLRDGEPASSYERGWRDALRLVADALDVTGHRLECICGAPVEVSAAPFLTGLWAHTADTGRACQRARPRCPECQMPHPLVPGTPPMCRSIRERTAARPPAADGLPAGALDSAISGAAMLDATARSPRTQNLLAHALTQLARDGWLRPAPGDGFDPADTGQPEAEPAAEPATTSGAFWFTGPDGARLAITPTADNGQPAVALQTAAVDSSTAVTVPADQIEDVVTGLRDVRRQAADASHASTPATAPGARVEYRARVPRGQAVAAIAEALAAVDAARGRSDAGQLP